MSMFYLINEDEPLYRNEETGEIISETDLYNAGANYCDSCRGFTFDETCETTDGRHFCESCAQEYAACNDCGRIITSPYDECPVYIGRSFEYYVCEDCANDYVRCDQCEHLHPTDDMYTEGNDNIELCNYCYEWFGYSRCDDCGDLYQDLEYDEDEGEYYCSNCIQRRNGAIRNYGYKPEPMFYGEITENFLDFEGIELEVDKGRNKGECSKEVTDIGGGFLYCKHDGSLDNGFEIVSHPATLGWHMNNSIWTRVFDKCREYGFTSHDANTCGLHIHVGRSQFGDTWEVKDDVVRKIIVLVYRFKPLIEKFSRRRSNQLNQWARMPDLSNWYSYGRVIDKYSAECIRASCQCNRYMAINVDNENTIEFRFYRGTLNPTSFYAALQLTDNICAYAIKHSWDEIQSSTWKDIVEYRVYNELNEYLRIRKIEPGSAADRELIEQMKDAEIDEVSYDAPTFSERLRAAAEFVNTTAPAVIHAARSSNYDQYEYELAF